MKTIYDPVLQDYRKEDEGSGSSGTGFFVITATPASAGAITGTFNKTAAEMRAAMTAGKELIVNLTDSGTVYTYHPFYVTDSTDTLTIGFFRSISGTNAPSDEVMEWYSDSSSYNLHAREGELTFRFYTMPTASSTYGNLIIQYLGATTTDYKQGHFYKAVESSGTYSWQEVNVGGAEFATQAEVNAGEVSDKAVSPLTLNNWTGGGESIYGIIYDPTVSAPANACQKVVCVDGGIIPVSGFSELKAHDFRRCVMSDLANRTIAYYLDPADSTKKYNGTFNGITSDGSASDLTGADGDVMVEIPITYWKVETLSDGKILYLVSNKTFTGATVHPFFKVGPGGSTPRKQYVGAFEATICNAAGTRLNTDETASASASFAAGYKARSVAGAKPWTSMTQATLRTAAANNGGRTINSLFKQYLLLMMVIEGGTFDTQTGISIGFTYANWNYAFTRLSGRCNYGNGTGSLLADATQDAAITWQSGATEAMKIVQFQYRGIENPYGHVWEFEDGIVKVDSGYYWTADDTKYSDSNYATDYVLKEHTWPAAGWVSAWDKESFFATAVSGSSTTYLADYFWIQSGVRVVLRGGHLPDTANAGAGSVYVGSALAGANANIGGRVAA